MGNCLGHESKMQWGGEDWSHVVTTEDEKLAMKMEEKLGISTGTTMKEDVQKHGKRNSIKGNSRSSSSKVKSTEVKIKITKKQLEKLLKTVDVDQKDGLTVQQVLLQMMKVGAHFETQQRSGWKPRLQSIPEL